MDSELTATDSKKEKNRNKPSFSTRSVANTHKRSVFSKHRFIAKNLKARTAYAALPKLSEFKNSNAKCDKSTTTTKIAKVTCTCMYGSSFSQFTNLQIREFANFVVGIEDHKYRDIFNAPFLTSTMYGQTIRTNVYDRFVGLNVVWSTFSASNTCICQCSQYTKYVYTFIRRFASVYRGVI